jgi:hypothetical protein
LNGPSAGDRLNHQDFASISKAEPVRLDITIVIPCKEFHMLRNAWLRSAALVLCVGFAGAAAALAQAPPPPRPVPALPPSATPPSKQAPAVQEYRAKQVLGTKVYIQGNVTIGVVDDVVFSDDGRVEYLLVANDGKLVSVPWQAAKFNFDKQMAVVNITEDQYRVIPRFGFGLLPRFFAPEYRVETYRYYGITPPQPVVVEPRR